MAHLLPPRPTSGATLPPLVIGLVNSMPGEARRATEQQFRAILTAAVRDVPVELRFFSLEPPPPDEAASSATAPRYEDTALLDAAAVDGMIVTGMPPRAASLAEEPYWPKLTELIDLARDAEIPTMWSCLAAHAAVLHLDGIERRRLPRKLSGLVACTRTTTEHPAMAGLPRRWRVPHSRYNDVPEQTLLARGYRILSRSAEAGADIFAKDDDAPFLFCQGHPEYDAQTLPREYRRDIRLFLVGERDEYPAAPAGCFGPMMTELLEAFRERALRERNAELIAAFPTAAFATELNHSWRDLAVGLYANWLADIAARKARRPDAGVQASVAAERRATGAAALPALDAHGQ